MFIFIFLEFASWSAYFFYQDGQMKVYYSYRSLIKVIER